jgi:hypothetical protein
VLRIIGKLTGQLDCISGITGAVKRSEGFKVVVAVDNDRAGESYASAMLERFPDAQLDRSKVGKDFNEDLKLNYAINTCLKLSNLLFFFFS